MRDHGKSFSSRTASYWNLISTCISGLRRAVQCHRPGSLDTAPPLADRRRTADSSLDTPRHASTRLDRASTGSRPGSCECSSQMFHASGNSGLSPPNYGPRPARHMRSTTIQHVQYHVRVPLDCRPLSQHVVPLRLAISEISATFSQLSKALLLSLALPPIPTPN